MLSKAVIKYITSLQVKKYRSLHQTFVVEGAKSVQEVLQADFEIEKVFATAAYLNLNPLPTHRHLKVDVVSEADLAKVGSYESNNAALALVKMKAPDPVEIPAGGFGLALDDVRDPGNLGTILRIADWYGLRQVVCSPSTADAYNPKVIAASMGSFTRVQAHYLDLPSFLSSLPPTVARYGAALQGENIHRLKLRPQGVLVMGNEAHGISAAVGAQLSGFLSIPSFGGAESLNVAIATAILLDNFFRESSE